MFSAIGRIPVLLAVFFAGLSGVQAEDSMTCRTIRRFYVRRRPVAVRFGRCMPVPGGGISRR